MVNRDKNVFQQLKSGRYYKHRRKYSTYYEQVNNTSGINCIQLYIYKTLPLETLIIMSCSTYHSIEIIFRTRIFLDLTQYINMWNVISLYYWLKSKVTTKEYLFLALNIFLLRICHKNRVDKSLWKHRIQWKRDSPESTRPVDIRIIPDSDWWIFDYDDVKW